MSHMNTNPSTKITKTKILALVAAGSLTLGACVGPHPTKVSIPAHRNTKASSLLRHSPERAITGSYVLWVPLDYATVPPPVGNLGFLGTTAKYMRSGNGGRDVTFDEWKMPTGTPAAFSAQRPTPAITGSYVNLYYQTVPPAGAIYVRTWARESLSYGKDMVFDEWAIRQGTPAPAPTTPTVSPAAQAETATISAPPQPCPVMIETVQTNSNGVNVIISRCY